HGSCRPAVELGPTPGKQTDRFDLPPRDTPMNATTQLDRLGQRLWLDNITRDLLVSGTLKRYMRDFAISGLTSNPTIFDHAIRNTNLYDEAIREGAAHGRSGEALFLDLALADVTAAADLFRPIYDAT